MCKVAAAAAALARSSSPKSMRVVSVLPSATEALAFIGGADLLVGRSHEDNFPSSITHLPVLTGQKTTFTTAADVDKQVSEALSSGQSLYTLDEALLRELKPDVILTQDLCEVCAIDLKTVERIAQSLDPQPKIVSLNPQTFEDVINSLQTIGDAVGRSEAAKAAVDGLLTRVAAVAKVVEEKGGKHNVGGRILEQTKLEETVHCMNVAFMEWPDPIYVGGHWTPQLITRAGGEHKLNDVPPELVETQGGGKSFCVTSEAFVKSNPDLIVVCPCGLNLEATRAEVDKLGNTEWWPGLATKAKVYLVDGDAHFNRPGPRLVDALEWLCDVINKTSLAPKDFPAEWLEPRLM